jgi:hypothetical protein
MMASLDPRRIELDGSLWIEGRQSYWHPCVVVGCQLSSASRKELWESRRAPIALTSL